MQVSCEDCGSFRLVRNGKTRRHQRYKCNWIRNFCEDIPPSSVPEGNYDLEFDEMWHFIQKKQTLNLESRGSCSEENRCLGCRQS